MFKNKEIKRSKMDELEYYNCILKIENNNNKEKKEILENPEFNYLGWPFTNTFTTEERIFDVI